MPTDIRQADINQLKNYEVEDEFSKLVEKSSSKNQALVSFVAEILKQMQQDNVYVSANVDKTVSELLMKDYRELMVSMLEDSTFIDKLSEIVQNKLNESSSTKKEGEDKETSNEDGGFARDDVSKITALIEKSLDKNSKKLLSSTSKEVEIAKANQEKEKQSREERAKKIAESIRNSKINTGPTRRAASQTTSANAGPRGKTTQAQSQSRQTKVPGGLATAAKKVNGDISFFNPMVNAFGFVKDIDKHVIEFTTFKFKSLVNLINKTGKSIVSGVRNAAKKLIKATPKAILTGLFGPFGLIFLPVFKLVGLGFKLVGAVFKIGRWAFGTIGKIIGFALSPFKKLFGKVHDKFMKEDKGFIGGLKKFLISPLGLFILGYAIGAIIGWVRKKFFGKKELKVDPKELTEKQKEKIQERFDHYALTGFGWDVAKFILGPRGAAKLDDSLKTVGTLLFGWESVDRRIKSNVERATDRAMGKRDTKSFSFMETASKAKAFFKDKVWPRIIAIKNAVTKSKIWNYFKEKGVLVSILAFAMTVNDVAKYMIDIAPTIFISIFGRYAVSGTLKATMWALKTFGSAATKKAIGGSLMANPWTWVGVAVLAAGAGLMNGINSIIKSQLDDAERLSQSNQNQEEAIKQLSGAGDGTFYNTETKEASSSGLFGVGGGGISGIMERRLVDAQKLIGDGQAKIDSATDSYQNIDTAEIDRMQEIGGIPPQHSPGVEFDIGEYANAAGKEMEEASKAQGKPTVNMPEFQSPPVPEDDSSKSEEVFDKLDKLLNVEVTKNTTNSIIPDKFDAKEILASDENAEHGLSLPKHIRPEFFKTYRALLLKNLLAMYKSGQINENKFIDMYNRSINPEDKMYKVYALDKPEGYNFSGISDADLKRLNSIFSLGYNEKHTGEVLDEAKQVPYYVLFQNYNFKDKKKTDFKASFFGAFSNYRKTSALTKATGMDNANAEMLKLGADNMEGRAAYDWWDWNTTSEARLKKIKGMYAERQKRILKSLGSFEDLTSDMDKNGADYDSYVELQRMYEKFKSSANTIDKEESAEEVQKKVKAFREAFLKRKQELMSSGESTTSQLEQTLDEQGAIQMDIAKDAGEVGMESARQMLDEVQKKAVDEAKPDMDEYASSKEEVEKLDNEALEITAEMDEVDAEIARLKGQDNDDAPAQENEEEEEESQGSLFRENSKYENLASRRLTEPNIRRNFYAMDAKIGDRIINSRNSRH